MRAFDTDTPGDTRGLRAALREFPAPAIRRAALLVKTEGNADDNDYSREYGTAEARTALSDHGGDELVAKTAMLYSTGCEGALTPFGYLFVDVIPDDRTDGASSEPGDGAPRLVFATARSAPLPAATLGTLSNVDRARETVLAATAEAGVGVEQVALVIVKMPVQSAIGESTARRITSARAKAVGALGSAAALDELDRATLRADDIDANLELYSRRTMVFSSTAANYVEVLLFANRPGAGGDLRIHSGLLRDVFDADGLAHILATAGLKLSGDGALADPDRMAALLIKAGIAADGRLRGQRTTMHTSHLDADKHVRATVSGMAGAVVGSGRIFVSANTVHQAPDGGGLCAVIVSHAPTDGYERIGRR